MQHLTRFSWLFGALGLLALVAFGSLAFVLGFGQTPTTAAGVTAAVLISAWALLDRDTLGAGVQTRAFRYGSGAFALVLLAGAVAIAGYVVADDHDTRFDWTQDKRFSLSDKGRSIAQELPGEVEVVAFFSQGSPERRQFERLVEGFQGVTDKLTVRWFDPVLNPTMAERFAITTEYGTVVLVRGDDRQRLEDDFGEEAFTQALIRLISGEAHRVCWSVGHGERAPEDDQSPEGLGLVVHKLEDQNYQVTKENLFTQGIDRACEALVIANPQQDFTPVERERVAVYLAEGGRLLVLLEPETVPELAAELHRYGVVVGDDIVIESDPRNHIADVEDPAVIALGESSLALHPITEPLKSLVVLWIARSVKGDPMVQGFKTHELMMASPDSWGETTLDIDPENPAATPDAFQPNEGVDTIGRVSLGVAVEVLDPAAIEAGSGAASEEPGALAALSDPSKAMPPDFAPKEGGRLVVLGDTDFASTQLMVLGDNQDLFLNSVAWLVEEESQLAASPEPEGDALTLTDIQAAFIWLLHVFLIPGAAVTAAAGVLLRRRFL